MRGGLASHFGLCSNEFLGKTSPEQPSLAKPYAPPRGLLTYQALPAIQTFKYQRLPLLPSTGHMPQRCSALPACRLTKWTSHTSRPCQAICGQLLFSPTDLFKAHCHRPPPFVRSFKSLLTASQGLATLMCSLQKRFGKENNGAENQPPPHPLKTTSRHIVSKSPA